MDLSRKEEVSPADSLSFLSKDSQFLSVPSQATTPTSQEPKTPVPLPDSNVPAYLAASIASKQEERLFEAPKGQMLQVSTGIFLLCK